MSSPHTSLSPVNGRAVTARDRDRDSELGDLAGQGPRPRAGLGPPGPVLQVAVARGRGLGRQRGRLGRGGHGQAVRQRHRAPQRALVHAVGRRCPAVLARRPAVLVLGLVGPATRPGALRGRLVARVLEARRLRRAAPAERGDAAAAAAGQHRGAGRGPGAMELGRRHGEGLRAALRTASGARGRRVSGRSGPQAPRPRASLLLHSGTGVFGELTALERGPAVALTPWDWRPQKQSGFGDIDARGAHRTGRSGSQETRP